MGAGEGVSVAENSPSALAPTVLLCTDTLYGRKQEILAAHKDNNQSAPSREKRQEIACGARVKASLRRHVFRAHLSLLEGCTLTNKQPYNTSNNSFFGRSRNTTPGLSSICRAMGVGSHHRADPTHRVLRNSDHFLDLAKTGWCATSTGRISNGARMGRGSLVNRGNTGTNHPYTRMLSAEPPRCIECTKTAKMGYVVRGRDFRERCSPLAHG